MSDPLAADRERALHHVVEAQAQLKRAALILRRTSGYYDDPLDLSARKRKRELEPEDWHDVAVRASAAANDLKRLEGIARELAQ